MAKKQRAGGGAERRTRQRRGPVTEAVDGGLAELLPDPDRSRAWTLFVDEAPQSHVDLDDPTFLEFDYQRRFGHVVDLVAPPGRPVRAVHLGGGGLTLARYVAATRPRSVQQAVESDAALVRLVRQALPLERNWRIRVRSGDARAVLGTIPDGWADLVVCDVFRGARTPAHLTSGEFLTEAQRALRRGGIWAANLTDGRRTGSPRGGASAPSTSLGHLRAQVATAFDVFADVCLLADPAVLRGRRFGNAVLVAGDDPLPIAELTRRTAGDAHPGRCEHGASLAAFAAGAAPVTDATAIASPEPPPTVFG